MSLFKKIQLILTTMLEKRHKKLDGCNGYYDIEVVHTTELEHSPTDDWESV